MANERIVMTAERIEKVNIRSCDIEKLNLLSKNEYYIKE